MNTRDKGALGEAFAVAFLKEKGYRILACNQFQKHEEIDIIAEKDTYRVFIEVKARAQTPDAPTRYGAPCMAVTPKKQLHLLSAARKYNLANKTTKNIRFDIIEVYFTKEETPRVIEIRHMEDVIRA